MALIVLPFFMPLLLLGWVFTPEHERQARKLEADSERDFANSWAQLFGSESQLMRRQPPD